MNNMIGLFETIRATGDKEMLRIVSKAECNDDKAVHPQLLVVSNPSARKEFIETLGTVSGCSFENFDGLVNIEEDFYVSFKYGNTDEMSDISDLDKITDIYVPWDFLKKADILWACVSSLTSIPQQFIVNSDKILLLTNATMAMTQYEKQWLVEAKQSVYFDESITVSLYGKYAINTREDRDALNRNINTLVARIGENIAFVENIDEAIEKGFENVDSQNLMQKRKNRIVKVCIDELEKYIKSQFELAEIDIEKLNAAAKKIEAERRNIEFSGKLVLNSTINNMYDALKNKILNAADKYSNDAYESIRARLTTSQTIEKDINNIAPYLKSVWENFEKEIGKRMASEQEQIASVLEQQISADCKKMVDLLAADGFDHKLNITAEQMISNITYDEMDESKAKKHKLLSKGMLIASIAMAFVNPFWGLAGIVGTSIFNRSHSKDAEEAREKVLSTLANDCNTIKLNVESQIETAIENSKRESCENVWKVYSDVIDNLMAAILNYMEQIKHAKDKVAALKKILDVDIPETKNTLNQI